MLERQTFSRKSFQSGVFGEYSLADLSLPFSMEVFLLCAPAALVEQFFSP